jgi:hypothetical protein
VALGCSADLCCAGSNLHPRSSCVMRPLCVLVLWLTLSTAACRQSSCCHALHRSTPHHSLTCSEACGRVLSVHWWEMQVIR